VGRFVGNTDWIASWMVDMRSACDIPAGLSAPPRQSYTRATPTRLQPPGAVCCGEQQVQQHLQRWPRTLQQLLKLASIEALPAADSSTIGAQRATNLAACSASDTEGAQDVPTERQCWRPLERARRPCLVVCLWLRCRRQARDRLGEADEGQRRWVSRT
jgi:hypothetical protein